MTLKQQLKIKGSVIDANNCLNSIFPAFNSLRNEFSPKTQLIDIFPNYFSFYHINYKSIESKPIYIYKLNKCVFHTLTDSKSVIVVSDASIKNSVATSIMLQSQDLRVGQEKEPCIGFTQENSIESSVQNYLPYILLAHGSCPTTLVCPN